MLALQAAAQDLDGGGLVVSGAQVVQARRGRASDCGAAAQVGSRAGGGAVESFGRGGGLEWRAGGAARCTGEGAGRRFREEEEIQ